MQKDAVLKDPKTGRPGQEGWRTELDPQREPVSRHGGGLHRAAMGEAQAVGQRPWGNDSPFPPLSLPLSLPQILVE